MSRDTQLGLEFPAINYFDGQGFMVRKSLGLASAKELNGKSVCTDQGTTTELNLADYFRANGLTYQPVSFVNATEAKKAYEAGRCEAMTTDVSGLYAARLPSPTRTITSSCRRSSPRSRSGLRCARATTSGPTSCAGPSTPCSMPRSSA